MCFFAVVGIPALKEKEWISKLPSGLHADSDRSYGGLGDPPECSLFLIAEGMCSCALYSLSRTLSKSRKKRLTKEYEKRGMSSEEIGPLAGHGQP